jgi:hypothetical protein
MTTRELYCSIGVSGYERFDRQNAGERQPAILKKLSPQEPELL